MLPIKDNIRSRSVPLVTWLIILANVLVFLYEISLSQSGLQQLIYQYGLVPANLNRLNPLTWSPLFSSMFLHGGWFHLISNMWILFIFGDNVEDRFGGLGYLLFYLAGGVAAGLLQAFLSPDASVPTVGASGAIAAVLGAYFLFYPRARVITLVPIFFFGWFVNIPAILYLGFWFVSQLFSGVLSLGGASAGGVAWWAHIGGFIFGLLMAGLARLTRSRGPNYPDDYWPW